MTNPPSTDRVEISAMIRTPGFYAIMDNTKPGLLTLVEVEPDGVVHQLRMQRLEGHFVTLHRDGELAPDGWYPTAYAVGPLNDLVHPRQ